MAGKGGKRSNAGRKQGVPNKSTQEIKEILSQEVDFAIVARKLFELVKGVTVKEVDDKGGSNVYEKEPNVPAAKVLLEYGFGKPKEQLDVTSKDEKIERVELVVVHKRNEKDKKDS